MNVFKDEKVIEIIEFLKTRLRKQKHSTKKDDLLTAPRFVFVCGKEWENNGDDIRKRIIKKLGTYKQKTKYGSMKDKVLCVISESLYTQDFAEDIFGFEDMLAEISQNIIVITESAGTYCELGAFVMDDKCFEKTIVINEDNEDYKNSFITNGPIKMLKAKNEDDVIFYKRNNSIDDLFGYKNMINRVVNEDLEIPNNKNQNELSLKGLIYELTNIIELFQPIDKNEVQHIYKEIKGFKKYKITNRLKHKITNIYKVLELMEKMKLIRSESIYYYVENNISCYNAMFAITRKEYNDIRIKYLHRLEKCQPERMGE